jgi:hypothetical protein
MMLERHFQGRDNIRLSSHVPAYYYKLPSHQLRYQPIHCHCGYISEVRESLLLNTVIELEKKEQRCKTENKQDQT